MAKRMSKKDTIGLFILIIVGGIIAGAVNLLKTIGVAVPIFITLISIIIYLSHKNYQDRKRLEYLRGKYNDEEIVQLIFDGKFWVGQDASQLLDSIGRPVSIDTKILKTKKKEVWKYHHQGGNRYRLRITLDNDEVVGWEKR